MNNKKKRIFDIIQIGYAGDVASRTFDIAITAAIIINLFIAIFDTFIRIQIFCCPYTQYVFNCKADNCNPLYNI